MQASILVDGSDVARFIATVGRRAANPRPAMRIVSGMLLAEVDENIATSGHGTFPPLAPSTIRQKQRRGQSLKPLFATGRMAASNEAEYGNDYAAVTNDVPYTIFHVSKEPRTRIPLRDFFDIPDNAFDACAQVVVDFIATGGR